MKPSLSQRVARPALRRIRRGISADSRHVAKNVYPSGGVPQSYRRTGKLRRRCFVRRRGTRPAKPVALEQIATELDECGALVVGLDAFTDDQGTDLVAQVAQRADRTLLDRAGVNPTHQ